MSVVGRKPILFIMIFLFTPVSVTIVYGFLIYSSFIFSLTNCSNIGSKCLVHFRGGDFILGGIIPIYRTVNKSCDGPIMERHGVPKVETMAYAVDMINRRSDILPNVTLGYEIRNDCREEDTSLWTTLTVADPCGEGIFHRHCPPVRSRFHTSGVQGRTVVGIIGPGSSATSLYVTRAAAIYEIPTIAYSASSDELSDVTRFPYFFRTVPPDKLQAKAIVDLLIRFNWKYIALYFSIDSYGNNGAEQIRNFAHKNGICIAINTPIPIVGVPTEWEDIVSNLKTSPLISVAVVFSLSVQASALVKAISNGNLGRRITFVGSDDLGGIDVTNEDIGSYLHGSFFVRFHSPPYRGFQSYWNAIEDSGVTTSPWYEEFKVHWKNRYKCSTMASCPFPPVSEATVINGVLAFAYALDATIKDTCRASTCNSTVNGQILKDNLLKVLFETGDGTFAFNENGETSGKYDIMNVQRRGGKYRFREIGRWNESGVFDSFEKIQWGPENPGNETNNKPPTSICRERCNPGFISAPLEKRCCWGCRRCSNNSIVINGTECGLCPFKHWPDGSYTECVPMEPRYVRWDEPGLVLTVFVSCIGIVVTILVTVEVIVHRDEPLIKATGRELSIIIICGLLLSFLTPFVIASPPSFASCVISEIFTAFSFLLIFGPTTLKVIRIFRIFRSGKRSALRLKCIRPADQIHMLSLLIATQILISIVSIFASPSEPHHVEANLEKGSLDLYCRYGYGFVASVIYNFILIVACCFFAFRTRKVPSNYNESRFIAISVYSTLIVCLSAVPVYFTATSVLYKVSTISAALILNGYLTLVLLFLPKIYAVKYLGSEVNVETWRSTGLAGSMHRASTVNNNVNMVNTSSSDNRIAAEPQ